MSNIIMPALVIGGGPAGLMAADQLLQTGPVAVFDAMPSLGRKFLRAGVGGLNLTHSEAFDQLLQRYDPQAVCAPWLQRFGPQQVREWAAELGVETFIGSSGRVFPVQKKASPLLRAWLRSLRERGARLHTRHHWCGWQSMLDEDGLPFQRHRFNTSTGDIEIDSRVTVMALGGGSWARLGSDAAWMPVLSAAGVACTPLRASNCGFDVSWSDPVRERFAGTPLKSVVLSLQQGDRCLFQQRGEALISRHGIQGSVVYAASRFIQQQIATTGSATLYWDLMPDHSLSALEQRLSRPRGKQSRSNFLRKALALNPVRLALLHEFAASVMDHPQALAAAIKALPMRVTTARPLDEAISTAGGIALHEVDAQLMLRQYPGMFCAGEMLDWDAPTGGYLLTACLASGELAGDSAVAYLQRVQSSGGTSSISSS